MTTVTSSTGIVTELGLPVPALPHAVSVSLPTWKDVVGYEESEARVVNAMKTGYPRFFIHTSIQRLSLICEEKFGTPGETSILVPSATVADECRSFIKRRSPTPVSIRLVQYTICPQSSSSDTQHPATNGTSNGFGTGTNTPSDAGCIDLHIVFFPKDTFPLAKQFWQHSGAGISSRMAEKCLEYVRRDGDADGNALPTKSNSPGPGVPPLPPLKGPSRYRGSKRLSIPRPAVTSNALSTVESEWLTSDHTMYLEERYGRNLPASSGAFAKRALRRRIAGVLLHDSNSPQDPVEPLGKLEATTGVVGESWRSVRSVTEGDVFLYPTGMNAIWSAHQLVLGAAQRDGGEPGQSVCFGFPYTDTLKILEKWGPGCHFLGNGVDSDIPKLEELLLVSSPAVLAVFCEFPSNPLLRSPNLVKLRELADRYGFTLVVDDTIGNLVNVDVLRYADVVVSSITKIFSGEANVMGGALMLNPQSWHYEALQAHLRETYEDNYWAEDALFMERNSRDFKHRIHLINQNTECIAEYLQSKSTASNATQEAPVVIKEVFYPKWVARENYDACKNRGVRDGSETYPAGYGGLFSITFTSPQASQVFFDNLACEKGPSLGTNFTLACPYTILAHYYELDWVSTWGVDPNLVRVSVGMEDQQQLLDIFKTALQAAQRAIREGA